MLVICIFINLLIVYFGNNFDRHYFVKMLQVFFFFNFKDAFLEDVYEMIFKYCFFGIFFLVSIFCGFLFDRSG